MACPKPSIPLRTTARITAFRPGQSPPPVNTPIRTGEHDRGPGPSSSESGGVTSRPAPLVLLAALACAVALGGCLGDDGEEGEHQPIRGGVLTVYSSRPTHGPSA